MRIVVSAVAIATFAFATVVSAASACSWPRDLKVGMTGDDVRALQMFLNSDSSTQVSANGTGSPGNETTKFGSKTKAAVVKFQEKYFNEILAPNGRTKGTGIVGPSTRSILMSLCLKSIAPTPPPTASSTVQSTLQVAAAAAVVSTSTDVLTVSDPGQEPSSLAPANATLPVLKFTLAAGEKDVTVSEVTIERTGFGADGSFLSFGLWDEQGLQIGPVATLSSSHQAIFRKSFIVRAGTSQTLEVDANMAADETNFDGQVPVVGLVAIKASSPVQASLPLRGSPNTVNKSLVVGGADATLSQFDPGVAQTRYIFDKNVRLAGIRITAHSQEDLTLSNIVWTQSGTIGSNDIENIRTIVNGKEYAATISPYSEKDFVSTFDPGIIIQKGNTLDVYVEADILPGAANRTIEFDIRDINSAVGLSGNLYHFSVAIAAAGNTGVAGAHSVFITSDGTTGGSAGTPFFAGSTITVKGTAVNVGKN